MGKADQPVPATGWLEYFHNATANAGFTGRGWKAELARALDVYDVQIGRWSRGERVPDVDSCQLLADAWRVPVVEVLVAAGHLRPDAAGLSERPTVPTTAASPELERLAALLDSDAPEHVKARIRAALSATADLIDPGPQARERPAG